MVGTSGYILILKYHCNSRILCQCKIIGSERLAPFVPKSSPVCRDIITWIAMASDIICAQIVCPSLRFTNSTIAVLLELSSVSTEFCASKSIHCQPTIHRACSSNKTDLCYYCHMTQSILCICPSLHHCFQTLAH